MKTEQTIASGCYPRYPQVIWTGDPPPNYQPWRETTALPHTIPSIAEQMGVDPISKLAAAIEKLAEALRETAR